MNIYEAMKMAKEGHRIRRSVWPDEVFVHFSNNNLVIMNGDLKPLFDAEDYIEEDWEVYLKNTSETNSSPWKKGNDGQSVVATIPNRQLDPSEVDYYGGQVICETVSPCHAERIIIYHDILRSIPTEELKNIKFISTVPKETIKDITNDIRKSVNRMYSDLKQFSAAQEYIDKLTSILKLDEK